VDLQQYVSEALVSVAKAIRLAQSDETVGHLVGRSPSSLHPGEAFKFDDQHNIVSTIEFDIATTVEVSGSGKAAINVVGIQVGGGVGTSSSHVSRVRFSVPFGITANSEQLSEIRSRQRRDDQLMSSYDPYSALPG
jgi:hypothetical protein